MVWKVLVTGGLVTWSPETGETAPLSLSGFGKSTPKLMCICWNAYMPTCLVPWIYFGISLTIFFSADGPDQCEEVLNPRYRKGPDDCFDYNVAVCVAMNLQLWNYSLKQLQQLPQRMIITLCVSFVFRRYAYVFGAVGEWVAEWKWIVIILSTSEYMNMWVGHRHRERLIQKVRENFEPYLFMKVMSGNQTQLLHNGKGFDTWVKRTSIEHEHNVYNLWYQMKIGN